MRFTFFMVIIAILFSSCIQPQTDVQKPNIVIIYVDDLGYADIGCYGAVGVETPVLDSLAKNGMMFTDAHCAAATCTPSRYSLLTGSFAFRSKAKVLPGDAPLLIRPETPTLQGMLQKKGYKTGVVGKWHLGLGDGNVNWNDSIKPGPLEIGFDYSFLIPATGDRVPCVYVENHHVVGLDTNDPIEVSYKKRIGNLPTGIEKPELLKQQADLQHSKTIINGISRIGYMSGGEKAWWVDEEFPDILTQKANAFIERNVNNPFFLYFSFHDIHVPRIPNERFEGKSSMGPRGDAIAQMDWCTGEIIKKLKELDLDKNTLVIFTSDNGPVLDDGYSDEAVEKIGGHNPSGPFRGGKYSAYEAGTRVPTIVYWNSVVKPGKSDALWSQVDLYHSIAKLIGHELDFEEAPDSYDMLDVLLGNSNEGRDVMLEEAFTFAVRKGNLKYIEPFEGKIPSWTKNKDIEIGLSHEAQLFDLEKDLGEQINIANENPEKVKELQGVLDKWREEGRSR